jgi:hypothetical protein
MSRHFCASAKVTAALLLRGNAGQQTVVDVVDMKIKTATSSSIKTNLSYERNYEYDGCISLAGNKCVTFARYRVPNKTAPSR